MKNKKLVIIIFALIAVILIAVGTFFLLQKPNSKNKDKEVKEIRNYQTVTPTKNGEMTTTAPTKEDFGKNAKSVGFEEVLCENEECIATNEGYSNTEYKDSITLSKDEQGGKTFNTTLYFEKSSFTVDNIYEKLSSVTNNYFGTEATKQQLKEVLDGLSQSSDDYFTKIYTSGAYTIEINMQNVVDSDFRLVKYLVLDTNLYNQYHNAQ